MHQVISSLGMTIIKEHEGECMGALIAEQESFRTRISLSNFLKGFIEIYPPDHWHGEISDAADSPIFIL